MNESCEWVDEAEGPGHGDLDSLVEAGTGNVEGSTEGLSCNSIPHCLFPSSQTNVCPLLKHNCTKTCHVCILFDEEKREV